MLAKMLIKGRLRKTKKAAIALKDEDAGSSDPVKTPCRSKKTKNINYSPVKTRDYFNTPIVPVNTDHLGKYQGGSRLYVKEPLTDLRLSLRRKLQCRSAESSTALATRRLRKKYRLVHALPSTLILQIAHVEQLGPNNNIKLQSFEFKLCAKTFGRLDCCRKGR